MRRRNPIRDRSFRSPRPRRLTRFAAGLALLLAALSATARAQDATPPPPPPDQTAAQNSDQAAESQVRAVRLSDVEGQVQVFQNGQISFPQAEPNMPAVEGMRFVTGDNGRLEIQFEDGSVARLAPNSSVRLTQLRRNPDGSTVTLIDALAGLTYFELKTSGAPSTVRFDGDSVTPAQDTVFRIALDPVPNQLAVLQGAVHVANGDTISLDVHSGQAFQMDPTQPGEFTVAQSIDPNSWDQWNSDRDQALASLAASESLGRSGSGNPDNPAWNDLDYYGDWYDVPGYGQVWAPSGVDASWDPFGNGYWGYYPSFGYTWISGYPWGWWPYHCGAWDYLTAWGWVWVPGNCGFGAYGIGWYPYSTVWRVPPGYHPPLRPRHGPGPQPRPTPLIPVDRGPQFSAPFRIAHRGANPGPRPAPRPLTLEGKTIPPVEDGLHPVHSGPLGESFTSTVVRAHPELAPAFARPGAPGALPGAVREQPAEHYGINGAPPSVILHNQPVHTFGPGAHPAPAGHPGVSGGGHVSSGSGGGHH